MFCQLFWAILNRSDLYLKETWLVWHCMTFVLFVNTSICGRYVNRLSKYCIIQLVKRFRGQGLGPRDLVRDIIQIVWVSAKMHNFQWNCIIIGFRGSKRVNVSTISTYWCSCLLFNGTRLKNWLTLSQLIQICIIFSFFYILHNKTVSIISSHFTRFKLPCIVYRPCLSPII